MVAKFYERSTDTQAQAAATRDFLFTVKILHML